MIEKATSCLNLGGKILAAHSGSLKRSQRALHSSFWNHGARDIGLPPWWNEYLKTPNTAQQSASVSDSRRSFELHSSFLDFLYPPKTLVFARNVSNRRRLSDAAARKRKPTRRVKTRPGNEEGQEQQNHDSSGAKPGDVVNQRVEDGQITQIYITEKGSHESSQRNGKDPAKQHGRGARARSRARNSARRTRSRPAFRRIPINQHDPGTAGFTEERPIASKADEHNTSPKTSRFTPIEPTENSTTLNDPKTTIIPPSTAPVTVAADVIEPGAEPDRRTRVYQWRTLSHDLGQAYEAYLELLDTFNTMPQLENDFRSILDHEVPIVAWQMNATIEAGTSLIEVLLRHLQEKTFPHDRADWSEDQWAFFLRVAFLHHGKQFTLRQNTNVEESIVPTGSDGIFPLLSEAAKIGKAFKPVQLLLQLTTASADVDFATTLLAFAKEQKFNLGRVLSTLKVVTAPVLARWIVGLLERIELRGYPRYRVDLHAKLQPSRRSYLELVNLMTRHLLQRKMTIEMNVATYEKVWAAFIDYGYLKNGHFMLALDRLNSVKSKDATELTAFVNASYKLFDIASKRSGFDWDKAKVQKLLHRMVLTHHCHCWALFQYYRSKFGFHSETYKLVLQELSDAGEVEHWEEVFTELQLNEVADKFEWIHQLLHAHAKRANIEACKAILESIETGLERFPDLASWNAALFAYVRADDMAGALKFHKYMKERGVKHDVSTSMVLLRGWASRGEYAQASDQLAQIRAEGHMLSGKMLYHLVSACLINQDMDTAEQLLFDTVDLPTEDSKTEAWNAVLTSYGHQGRLADLNYIHGLMYENGLRDNEQTYAALMLGFWSCGDLGMALSVVRDIMPMYNVVPTIYHWNIMMDGLLRWRRYEQVLEIYQSLKSLQLKPDVTTQSIVLRAMASMHGRIPAHQRAFHRVKHRAFEQAEEFLRQSLETNDVQHLVSKSAMIGREGQPIDQAFASLRFSTLLIHSHNWTDEQRDELIKRYQAFYAEKYPNQEVVPPIRMLTAIADHYLQRNNLSGIDEIWQQALESMTKFALRTNFDTTQPDHVLRSRSTLLGPLFRPYMISLMKRNKDVVLGKTISDLTRAGWRFASPMWNSYVVFLAERGEVHLAFRYAETHLIDGFRGWPQFMRKRGATPRDALEAKPPGSRIWQIKKPAYATLVWLSHAYIVWRRRNAFNVQRDNILNELWDMAPNTLKAITSMPRIDDREQTLILKHGIYAKTNFAAQGGNGAFADGDGTPTAADVVGLRM